MWESARFVYVQIRFAQRLKQLEAYIRCPQVHGSIERSPGCSCLQPTESESCFYFLDESLFRRRNDHSQKVSAMRHRDNSFHVQSFSSSSLRPASFKSLVQSVRLSRRSCMMVAESRYSSSSRVSRSAIALSKAFFANLHAISGLFRIS